MKDSWGFFDDPQCIAIEFGVESGAGVGSDLARSILARMGQSLGSTEQS